MNRNLILNLIFIVFFLVFLILSFMLNFFFFIPIICFLPFSFRTFNKNKEKYEANTKKLSIYQNFEYLEKRYCPRCGGEITKDIAKFCYHCGEKLYDN